MKKLFPYMLAASLCSCAPMQAELPKAKIVAEDYFQQIDKENYEAAFAHDFNSSGITEEKIEKYKKLKAVFGNILSFELIDSTTVSPESEGSIMLTYRIKHSNRSSIEKFLVLVDEGEHKISYHHIENAD